MGFESVEAKFLGRGLGFSILAITLVFIATLFQWGRFTSFFEIYAVLFLFTLFAFLNQLLMYLKILKTHNDQPVPMANVIRPLIPLIVIIIAGNFKLITGGRPTRASIFTRKNHKSSHFHY